MPPSSATQTHLRSDRAVFANLGIMSRHADNRALDHQVTGLDGSRCRIRQTNSFFDVISICPPTYRQTLPSHTNHHTSSRTDRSRNSKFHRETPPRSFSAKVKPLQSAHRWLRSWSTTHRENRIRFCAVRIQSQTWSGQSPPGSCRVASEDLRASLAHLAILRYSTQPGRSGTRILPAATAVHRPSSEMPDHTPFHAENIEASSALDLRGCRRGYPKNRQRRP
jgi:hypothetical protein